MKSVAILCLWLFFAAAYECRKLTDRNKYRKYSDLTNSNDMLDICDLEHNQDVNINCYCNHAGLNNASNAKCWLFNDFEKEESFIWDEFRSQSKLKSLLINVRSKPSLTFIPTRTLTHLPELLNFSLIYANITTLAPHSFANLSSLQKLELKQNQIQILEKYSIANLPNLNEIALDQNSIREVGRDVFRNLPSLKSLHLEENQINVVQDLAFADLKSLEVLDLHKNQLTAISRNTFAGLASLRHLDLHSNLLSELKDFTFTEMPRLRELIIEQNMIESIGGKVFYGIQHLDKLVLAENKLHILPDDVFTSLPNLHVLDLRDNLLQTFTYDTAMPILDKLKNDSFYFYIEGNRLECDCNLSWLRSLANDTANDQLRSKLQQLSCYMKGNYYNGEDIDPEINTNGLSDSRVLGDTAMSDSRKHDSMSDNVDRMLKLFNIPQETLPCPEKRQANEILMEQMSKNENISTASKIFYFNVATYCISILATMSISKLRIFH